MFSRLFILYFFLVIFLFPFSLKSQEWSPPIVVNGGALNFYPDFSIVKSGMIMCVWSEYIKNEEYRILGATSLNFGLTWTEPEQIAYKPEIWLSKPKVVIDLLNVPYVCYLYNLGNYQQTQVYIRRYFTGYWNDPVLVSGIYTGMQDHYLFIDHNNTIYSFWNIGFYPVYMFLNYKLITLPDWNGAFMPFSDGDSYQVIDCDVDKNNLFHCIAKRSTPTISNSLHMEYFTGYNNAWSHLSTPQIDSISGGSISTDNQSVAHCAFQKYYYPDTNHFNYGYTYAKFKEDEWSTEIPIVSAHTNEEDFAVDHNGNLHFVANEVGDSVYRLVYYLTRVICGKNELLKKTIFDFPTTNWWL